MASSSKTLTEADWLPHKHYISLMIHGENLANTHILRRLEPLGLKANKNQLENQLKKWNMRRKLPKGQSKAAWQCIGHRVSKRRKQGKESKVIINGRVYDAQDVAKEVSRNQLSVLEKVWQGPTSPKSPEGMIISVCSPNPLELEVSWPQRLPWFKFQRRFTISIPSNVTDLTQSVNDLLGLLTRHSIKWSTQNAVYRDDRSSSSTMSQLVSGLQYVMPEAYTGESLSRAQSIIQGSNGQRLEQLVMVVLFQLSNDLHSDELIDIWPTILGLFRSSGLMESPLQLNGTPDFTMMAVAEKLYRIAFRAAFHPDTRQSDSTKSGTRKLIKWLLSSGQDPNVLVLIGKYAFGTSLHAAVLYQEADLALALLDKGANPNLIKTRTDTYMYRPRRTSPLLVAIDSDDYAQRAGLIEALLRKGADPNLFDTKTGPCPLRAAICRHDFFTVRLLLAHGARISEWPVFFYDEVIEWCSERDYEGMDWVNPEEPIKCFAENQSVLGCAAGICPETVAWSMVQILLEHLKKHMRSYEVADAIPVESLLIAAARGYNTVLALFLDQGILINAVNNYDYSPLHAAAFWGRVDSCRMLLERGALAEPPISRLWTPLQLAAFGCHSQVVQLLHQWGAKINLELLQMSGSLPSLLSELHLFHPENFPHTSTIGAAEHNAKATYRYLIANGATIPRWMAYHIISDRKNFELASFLLENGQDPNERERGRETLLQASLALDGDDNETTRLLRGRVASDLLDRGAILVGGEAVQAIILGNWELVERILRQDHDGIARKHPEITMVHAALLSRDQDIIRKVLDLNPGVYDSRALCVATLLACENNNGTMHIVAQLLSDRALYKMPDDEETLAVGIASWYENIPLLKLLLERFPPRPGGVPQPGKFDLLVTDPTIVCAFKPIGFKPTDTYAYASPLSFTLKSPKARRLLLDHGCKADWWSLALVEELLPRYERLVGFCIISKAVKYGNFEIVKSLIEAGEDVNGYTIDAERPLHTAVRKGNSSIINLLLDYNADVNCPASSFGNKRTALQIACEAGYLSVAQRLISLGARIDEVTEHWLASTALESAAKNGRIDMIQLLLSSGASTTGRWRQHYLQAIALAERNGHQAAAKILRLHREWTTDDEQLYSTIPDPKPLSHWNENRSVYDAYLRVRSTEIGKGKIEEVSDSDCEKQMTDTELIDRDGDEQMANIVDEGTGDVEDMEQAMDTSGGFSGPSFNMGFGNGIAFGDSMDLDDWPHTVDLGSSDFGNVGDGNGV
ncbi:ankyrin repeat-containing domain protein [Hypoxylon sp. FL1857]|nr:ankyrin repeat-containing domain protein [Hypoxylon sp. FL1857]